MVAKDSSQLSTYVVRMSFQHLMSSSFHKHICIPIHLLVCTLMQTKENMGICTGHMCGYLNTIAHSTPSTYMSTHAHVCIHKYAHPSRWTLSPPVYLQVDIWTYSRIHMHTHPDAWDINPIMAHELALTLYRAALGSILTPWRTWPLSPC